MLPSSIVNLLERQYGVIARRQLLEHLSPASVDGLLRRDRFERMQRGVARVRGSWPHPVQEAFAATLRAGPGATLTGPLALSLLRVPSIDATAPFEVLTPPGRRLRGVAFPHRRDPDPGRAVARYGDVRVAGPVDALIDAAAFVDAVGERALRVAWDQLRWHHGVREERLRRRLERLQGAARGVEVLRQVLADGGGTVLESEGERALATVLGCFEPAFEPQVWVTPRRRVDFFSRRVRYGYEYLGEVDHATVAARVGDDARDSELRLEGIRLGYVTAGDLREPAALLATIAGTLTVRAHELGVAPPVAVRAGPLVSASSRPGA
jgi:hypothetical protein